MVDQQQWAQKARTACQDFLGDEQVLSAVSASRGGGWGSMAVSQLSPLAGSLMSRKDKKRAAGLPPMFLLALTPTHVVALGMPKMNYNPMNVRAVKELVRWERAGMRVETQDVFQGTLLKLTRADGEEVVVKAPAGEVGLGFADLINGSRLAGVA